MRTIMFAYWHKLPIAFKSILYDYDIENDFKHHPQAIIAVRKGTSLSQLLKIRPAQPQEAETLSELALRSKAHWNYDPNFLEACRRELTLTPEFIANNAVYVLEEAGSAAGFYGMVVCDEKGGTLEFLYVEPESIGMGYGKDLWDHAVATARAKGLSSFTLEADPNAEAFYQAMGATRIGERESPVRPGRMLPLMRYCLP